jgi:hypothetical protein
VTEPRPVEIAAAVTTDDVRKAFYDNAPHDAWICEIQLDPLQLIVTRDDGDYARVPVTINRDGTFTFGQMTPVQVTYIDEPAGALAAASAQPWVRYASRAVSRAVAAGPPDPPTDPPTGPAEEGQPAADPPTDPATPPEPGGVPVSRPPSRSHPHPRTRRTLCPLRARFAPGSACPKTPTTRRSSPRSTRVSRRPPDPLNRRHPTR